MPLGAGGHLLPASSHLPVYYRDSYPGQRPQQVAGSRCRSRALAFSRRFWVFVRLGINTILARQASGHAGTSGLGEIESKTAFTVQYKPTLLAEENDLRSKVGQ